VWATGYACDFSWIKMPVLDGNGDPVHERGVTKRAGLYFLGLRIGSALVAGAVNDAAYIADHIAAAGRAS
jgi:putative flavoprotein involved in K+ transport